MSSALEEEVASTSDGIEGGPLVQGVDKEVMQQMQSALMSKIGELEAAEAEEKEAAKNLKKAIRDIQKILTNKDLTAAEKLEQFQEKLIERVNEHFQAEKKLGELQKKLDRVTAERAATSDEVRKLNAANSKLQDLCRTLQAQNKTIQEEAAAKALEEAKQREELGTRMETAMRNISDRLDEHRIESEKCMKENMELREKLDEVGRFCEEMDADHKEQLQRKDIQISFLRERMREQAELLEDYAETEKILQDKCAASEVARESCAKQLEDAKNRINGFCDSFEKSNSAFKQLQDQIDMSQRIQKKMQQESDLLKKRSSLVQQKAEKLAAENDQLKEQIDGMRSKLESSVTLSSHNQMRAQKNALEKVCRVLQAEVKELRKRVNPAGSTSGKHNRSSSSASSVSISHLADNFEESKSADLLEAVKSKQPVKPPVKPEEDKAN